MKLHEIRLQNFRQFYDQQVLEISTDDDRNLTLIHAENGFGKTTLLNALLWCFYGQTTGKFENKDDLVNFEAVSEGKKEACVEVLFDYDGQVFLAQRKVVRGRERRSSLKVFTIVEGSYQDLTVDADSFLNSVIPGNMAKYFFFDGEQAEAFSSETNYKAVGEAIRTMLGCDVAQTAIDDLKYWSKDFDRKLGELPGQEAIAQRERDLSERVAEFEGLEKLDVQISDDCGLLNEQIDQLVLELQNIREVAALQRSREEFERRFKGAEGRRDELLKRRNTWFSRNGLALT